METAATQSRDGLSNKDGGFTDYTTAITINNVAPTLALVGPAFVDEGELYTLNLSIS